MKIGIVLVATNSYFVLGVRFIKKYLHHYTGEAQTIFHFFSDEDPTPYLPAGTNVVYHKTEHTSWTDATNSKFTNILSLDTDCDYLFYFDADTNVSGPFDEGWFLGDLVGGEHYANAQWMQEDKGFDRNPLSRAYVPLNTKLPQTYYYGAFFGGKIDRVREFCTTLCEDQAADKLIDYEPGVNDESYINRYFHYNRPMTVATRDFRFNISDKGGLGDMRNTKLDVVGLKSALKQHKDVLIDVRGGVVVPGG